MKSLRRKLKMQSLKIKIKKAPGFDGITNEMIMSSSSESIELWSD